jgi:diguanylate cyclase (GGDEF)-like protein
MTRRHFDFSPTGWARVTLWTVLGTIGCVVITLLVDSVNLAAESQPMRLRGMMIDILLPMLLASPLLFFFTSKLRDLAIANEKMSELAMTDSLTAVLNRGAFTSQVEARLMSRRSGDDRRNGALLIIDADNFKAINDTYGHDGGDDALRTIAGSIRRVLRRSDLVGRMGGEEFGVFLEGCTRTEVESIAERIRMTVARTMPPPTTPNLRLSVSLGGAFYCEVPQFRALFRLADQQLYLAKRAGRNRVAIAVVPPPAPLAEAA